MLFQVKYSNTRIISCLSALLIKFTRFQIKIIVLGIWIWPNHRAVTKPASSNCLHSLKQIITINIKKPWNLGFSVLEKKKQVSATKKNFALENPQRCELGSDQLQNDNFFSLSNPSSLYVEIQKALIPDY
jgi:hypothetical protein